MTSLAESSMASVPVPDLLSLQGHLLQYRRLSADVPTTEQLPEANRAQTNNNDLHSLRSTSNDGIDEIPESVDAEQLSEQPVRSQPPLLTPSRSAPADIDAMVQQTPSQSAFATMTRAISFHGYPAGDTQPMESQVYRDFTESMAKSSATTPKKPVLDFGISPNFDHENTYDTAVTDNTTRALGEDETGFIDLANAWQPEVSQTAHSTTSDLEDLLASPQTRFQEDVASKAHIMPVTPSLAGHKRRGSGEYLSSDVTDTTKKTPGFSQAFGITSRTPALSVSQLFNQTQAPSSPMLDVAYSDPVLTRPSPNLRNPGQFSSPAMTTFSPMLMTHNVPASTAGEPRETYTSMRESQERRAARLREELELQKRFGPGAISAIEEEEEDEDEVEDIRQRRVERKRIQRVMSDQALDEWSKYRVPSRPGSRSASRRKRLPMIDLITPATMRKGQRVEFDVSDDEGDDNLEAALAVENEDAHEGGSPDEELSAETDDENDVYDEFGQTVLRSQKNFENEDEVASVQDENALETSSEAEDADEVSGGEVALGDLAVRQPAAEENGQREEGFTGTQPAVADSQSGHRPAQHEYLKHTESEPSGSSFVPGSQYAGSTSQELARQLTKVPNSSDVLQPPADRTLESTVPSSPPLAAQIQPWPTLNKNLTEPERVIPESDGLEPYVNENVEEGSGFTTATDTNSMPIFSTAPTHRDNSALSPGRPSLVKTFSKMSASQQSAPSPLKAAGVRRFAEMTANSSSSEENIGSSMNVDDIISNVITMDDQNFIDALSSPPSQKPAKRRRLKHSVSSGRPLRKSSTSAPKAQALDEQVASASPSEALDTNAAAEILPPIVRAAALQSLQNSPGRGNEIRSATPEEIGAPSTSESVRRREEAGGKAASQLLSASSAPAGHPSKLSGTGRKTALSRKRRVAPSRTNPKAKVASGKPSEDVGVYPSQAAEQQGNQLEGIGEDAEPAVEMAATTSRIESPAIARPERVFALFKGSYYNAYYPGSWLSTTADGKSHKIQFDDTTVTTIDAKNVRALELRKDDVVKVDFEGYRNKTWVVKGFGRSAQDAIDRANGVDIHDHVTIKVQAKMPQRMSLPASGMAVQGEGEIFEVLVANVKLTHTMLPHFADRVFIPPNAAGSKTDRAATPSNGVLTPELETPGSRSRRAIVLSVKASGALTSKLREGSVASSNDLPGTGMFDDMAFAISYASNEAEKAEVARQIRHHGGVILEQGFDELFVPPQLNEPLTPSKRFVKPAEIPTDLEIGTLRLKPEYQHLGFVALIADKHSRRAKYMQALSLGLPTLSGRWILDSLDATRNPSLLSATSSDPRAWSRYLLPAGESAYLGGAVRSRTIVPYEPASALLATTVASREMMLKGEGVLLVAPKKGKWTWERRKTYVFLTLALGAGSVKRVADLAEAKSLLAEESEKWAWVYVDEEVGEAAKVLFGNGAGVTGGGGKKRKRGSDMVNRQDMCVTGIDGRVKVVGDEFVVQSLILGALVD